MAVLGSVSPCIALCISLVCSRKLLLGLHVFVEAVNVDCLALLFKDLLSYLQRESVSVVELECEISCEHVLALCIHLCHVSVKYLNASVKSLCKVVFFDLDDLHNVIMLFDEFRICPA